MKNRKPWEPRPGLRRLQKSVLMTLHFFSFLVTELKHFFSGLENLEKQ